MDRIKYYYEEERDVSYRTVQSSFHPPVGRRHSCLFRRLFPVPATPRQPPTPPLSMGVLYSETEVSKVWPLPSSGAAIDYTARNAFFISSQYYHLPSVLLIGLEKRRKAGTTEKKVTWQCNADSFGVDSTILRIVEKYEISRRETARSDEHFYRHSLMCARVRIFFHLFSRLSKYEIKDLLQS